MDERAAHVLAQATSEFYERCAASFSGTRHNSWPGWDEACRLMGVGEVEALRAPVRVLDAACGNLRFERYLQQSFPQTAFSFYTADNCAPLAAGGEVSLESVAFQQVDIIENLLAGGLSFEAPLCDIAVSFGFMHHIPGAQNRTAFLRCLLDAVKPGGFAVVSLWRFMEDEGLAAKADATHGQALAGLAGALGASSPEEAAALFEEGDRMLGWQNEPGIYRYCHSFTDAEIDELAARVAGQAHEFARFNADGRTGSLNTYLILQKYV